MKPKAYCYIRMSTDAQANGDSFRRQSELSKAWAEANGLDLVEDFLLPDVGVSAFRGDNLVDGALSKFFAAMESGEVPKGSYLLVENFDRLSRDRTNRAQALFFKIVNGGVSIVTLTDGQIYREGESELGKLMQSLVAMHLANEESEKKSYRIGAAWEQKRKQISNLKLTRKCPAWLELSDDRRRFIADQGKAKIVRDIFTDAASGVGTYLITKELNVKGIPTFGRSPAWNQSYVKKILKNRAVLGEFQPHRVQDGKRKPIGEAIEDYFPILVDEHLFLLAQSAMRQRAANKGGRRGPNQTNLFSHLLRCEYCGGSLRYQNKGYGPKGGQYLRCVNGLNGKGCTTRGWKYSDFETTFLSFVREIDIRSLFVGAEKAKEAEALVGLIKSAEEKQRILHERMERDYEQLTKDETLNRFFRGKLEKTQLEIDEGEAHIARLQEQHQTIVQGLCQEAPPAELNAWIAALQSPGPGIDRKPLSSKIKDIVREISVATDGPRWKTGEVEEKMRQSNLPNEAASLIRRKQANSVLTNPFFKIFLRDGGAKAIVPDLHNPSKLLLMGEINSHGSFSWETRLLRV